MTKKMWQAVGFLAAYFGIRWGMDQSFWQTLSPYYAYGFEILFVAVALLVYRGRCGFRLNPGQLWLPFIFLFVGGWAIYELAIYANLTIPFDLQGGETIFLLLILAPVLEELLFRFALWEPAKDLWKKDSTVLIATTAFFSFGHLTALWTVPVEYRSFVLYQTLYVVVLGLACGWVRLAANSLAAPMLLHFAFNLGFFLAYKI